jgi:hypothetical protein
MPQQAAPGQPVVATPADRARGPTALWMAVTA